MKHSWHVNLKIGENITITSHVICFCALVSLCHQHPPTCVPFLMHVSSLLLEMMSTAKIGFQGIKHNK
jgi:hypothetical protein